MFKALSFVSFIVLKKWLQFSEQCARVFHFEREVSHAENSAEVDVTTLTSALHSNIEDLSPPTLTQDESKPACSSPGDVTGGDDVIEHCVERVEEVDNLYRCTHRRQRREADDVREVDGGGGVEFWVDRLPHLQLVGDNTAKTTSLHL